MINYRYHILDKLGEGGSGEVYLVEDTLRDNQQVALKTLHSTERVEASFHNEVSTLVNLSHPHLVSVFDFGTIRHSPASKLEGKKFFTMEYVEGAESLAWISRVSGIEKKESVLEALLLQSLSVLAYIHREGILHFDIKPQNLIVIGGAGNPVIKLTDFGFSTRHDDALEIPLRGTLEYSAPELLQGEAYDQRIDLYSLGVTFFHLMEGKCPFEAAQPVELVKKVLHETATFAFSREGPLKRTVQRLMEKKPTKRFQTAKEAATGLLAERPNRAEILSTHFGFAKRSRFVGRIAEKNQMEHAVRGLLGDGNPLHTAFMVTGVEGIGKTSLLNEMAKSAQAREIPVVGTETVQTGIPFQSILLPLRLLRTLVRSHPDGGEQLIEKYRDVLWGEAQDVFTGEVWAKEREKFVETVARFIEESSRMFPFVIIADNLHLIDEASLNILTILARDAEPGRMLVIAAGSPELSRSPFAEVSEKIMLHELDLADLEEMTVSIFGRTTLASDISSKIHSLYGGTPAVAVEAFRALHDILPEELLTDADAGKKFIARLETSLPMNIDEFLLKRFHTLTAERQLVLSVLSCFLHAPRVNFVEAVLPFHPLRARGHLLFLQLDGYLSFSEHDQRVLIRIARLKTAIYSSISDDHKELHSLIASKMEESVSSPSFEDLWELAHQFHSAGDIIRASDYYERAADEGSRLYALANAIHLYGAAVQDAEAIQNPQRLNRVQVKRANALFQEELFTEAIQLADRLAQDDGLTSDERKSLFKIRGLAESRLGENEKAAKMIHDALALSVDESEQIELKQELVGIQIALGNFREAEQACLQQLDHARQLANEKLMGSIYTDLGISTFFQDRFDDAATFFDEARRRYEHANERTQVANAINNIGNALSAKGDFTKAIEFWSNALQTSQEFGTLNQQAQIQNNLGIAYYNLKQYDMAKEFYEHARALYERIKSKVGLAYALTNFGEVSLAEGEYEAALRRWDEAHALYREMDDAHALVEIHLHRASVHALLGNAEAMNNELAAADLPVREKNLETFLGKYYYWCGMERLVSGAPGEARENFSKAHGRFVAERNRKEAWRCLVRIAESFVDEKNYRESADILTGLVAELSEADEPHTVAEVYFLLGKVASEAAALVPERPLSYFKHGIDVISKQPVGEITWKLSFHLAREYYERGQQERAKEFLIKARLVLLFFLSHFTSDELKKQYLAAGEKDKVLSTIEAIVKN